ncbi:helix-turn-helix domain-containing protein [Sandaracinomonas limnophila]|nr:AraC family transcriptional regulator [Sandaracinomonas limnophila]
MVKFLQGKLVFNPWKSKKFTYWILGMIVLRAISNLFLLYRYIVNYQPSISPTGLEWLLSMDACFSILFLIFNPDILDFHYLKEYQKSIESSNGSGNSEEDSYQIHCENVCKEINQILEAYHYFTKSECTVENIYLQSKIPQRVISFSFRQVYGMSIKDFINKKRVDYLIELYKKDDLMKKYSLDYIGELVGFQSRQTLYSCTEKFYGCTPKTLFEKVDITEI